MNGMLLVDQCAACTNKARRDRENENLRRADLYSGYAQSQLRSGGRPMVHVFKSRFEVTKRMFGKYEHKTYLDRWRDGWVIGSFRWEYLDGSDSTGVTREDMFQTVLLLDHTHPHPNRYASPEGLVRVTRVNGELALDERSGSIKFPRDQRVTEAIEKLISG